MEVRERIRINGKPLPKDKFAKYFFDCWDNLLNNGDVSNQRNIMTCVCKTCFNSRILLLHVLVHFFCCPHILSLSRKLSTARCHLVQAIVYIAKRKIILSLVWHWIIKINGLNPLSHGALCQKHVFWAFWNFCAGMLTKLIPIYSKRRLQHDSIPFFPLAPRFMTFSELHVKKTICTSGTSAVSLKFLSSLAPWARALARCPPTKFLMTILKRVNFWCMESVWIDLDKNYKF